MRQSWFSRAARAAARPSPPPPSSSCGGPCASLSSLLPRQVCPLTFISQGSSEFGMPLPYITYEAYRLALGRRETRQRFGAGRASQRLQETAGVPSSTIHRLLGYRASTGDRSEGNGDDDGELEGSYHHCRSTPLQACFFCTLE